MLLSGQLFDPVPSKQMLGNVIRHRNRLPSQPIIIGIRENRPSSECTRSSRPKIGSLQMMKPNEIYADCRFDEIPPPLPFKKANSKKENTGFKYCAKISKESQIVSLKCYHPSKFTGKDIYVSLHIKIPNSTSERPDRLPLSSSSGTLSKSSSKENFEKISSRLPIQRTCMENEPAGSSMCSFNEWHCLTIKHKDQEFIREVEKKISEMLTQSKSFEGYKSSQNFSLCSTKVTQNESSYEEPNLLPPDFVTRSDERNAKARQKKNYC